MIKICETILLCLGACTANVIILMVLDYLRIKLKQIMKRQSKIRCLCDHRYEFKTKWHNSSWDYYECEYRCRKCGKILKYKLYKPEDENG